MTPGQLYSVVFGVVGMLLLTATPSSVAAQVGAISTGQTYESPDEASKHLPPLPDRCTNPSGQNLCEPSYLTQRLPNSSDLAWAPGPWMRRDTGEYCIDKSGKVVVPCGVAGAYRPTRPVPTISIVGQPTLEPRIRFADHDYGTPEEAMKHLLSIPPGCGDAVSGVICVPTFITSVTPTGIAWRPAEWVRADHKGVCADASGKVWKACGSPDAGSYRLLVPSPPPPPPLFLTDPPAKPG